MVLPPEVTTLRGALMAVDLIFGFAFLLGGAGFFVTY